ncbi:uncharacterized protein LOC106949877 [Poecilia latipinna]|uniref:uncharacterized protein LOC106949877 n=1 Tax=Poecilia latipinna TaxID=48699 RepID=UPI00072DC816|nr:PREDICTED: uncharacterized protein LOC106949877 [Poecilia latipinna]
MEENGLTFETKASETQDDKFVCKVFNEVSSEPSEPVAHSCAKIDLPSVWDLIGGGGGCDRFAAVGGSFIVPLGYRLKPTDTLKWKLNGSIIFNKKPGRISVGTESDINADGSLKLVNLRENQAGLYTSDVFDENGKLQTLKSTNLCLLDCDQFAAADRNFVVPLGHQLKPTDSLKWEFNGNMLFYKRSEEVVIGKTEDINEDGSLKLINLKKNQTGRYTSEVFDETRKARTMKETNLCVIDPVKKPKVNITCQDGNMKFRCFLGSSW